ncbi:MAG: TetR family transcriptional regulator [Proteobacteria bacterium]|nr:TetR family transcriptional regulator [Pseudomonadota bacterium]
MEQEKLTREIIVGEAITLLNEEGLEGVSLRKLAERVGVKAPSLYWHFKDKSALMSAVMERIFGECLDSVPDHTDWQQWMRAFGKALWRTQGMVRTSGDSSLQLTWTLTSCSARHAASASGCSRSTCPKVTPWRCSRPSRR